MAVTRQTAGGVVGETIDFTTAIEAYDQEKDLNFAGAPFYTEPPMNHFTPQDLHTPLLRPQTHHSM
jgi:hypothetical protein